MLDPDVRAAFLTQFKPHERPTVTKLLQATKYLSRAEVKALLSTYLARTTSLSSVCFVGLGRETESGNEILTDLRRASSGSVAVDQCYLSNTWQTIPFAQFSEVVFIDDFIGSGQQATKFFDRYVTGNFSKRITYLYLAGLQDGIEVVCKYLAARFPQASVEALANVEVRGAFEIGHVFQTESEVAAAREICEKYGLALQEQEGAAHQSSYPMGFGGCSALFATEYNTPNNTLPILWSTALRADGTRWISPYPRSHKRASRSRPEASPFTLRHKMHEAHKIGTISIEDIVKYQKFDPPLTKDDVRTTLSSAKPLPVALERYYRESVEERVARLRGQGKSVQINNGYSLRSARIDKIQAPGVAGRKHIPYLEFEPADYSHQIMFGERIKEAGLIRWNNDVFTIREYMERFCNVSFAHFEWAVVGDMPIPQRFANVVGLVARMDANDASKGSCLVCGLRSRAMAVSNEENELDVWQATMACAEGMLRPDDAGGVEGAAPSPFNTARRALESELGLEAGVHFKESDIKMLALAYDGRRCQPVGCFFLEVPNLDYEALEDLWNTQAEDNNEAAAIFPVPLDVKSISSFLRGDLTWDNKNVRMFSNHQQIGMLAVAEHVFGAKQLAIY